MALTLGLVVNQDQLSSNSYSHLAAVEAAIALASGGTDLGSTPPQIGTPHNPNALSRQCSQPAENAGHVTGSSSSSTRGRLMLLNVSAVVASLKALAIADLTLAAVPSPPNLSHLPNTSAVMDPEPDVMDDDLGRDSSSSSSPLRLRWEEYRRQARDAGRCWVKFLSARSAAEAAEQLAGENIEVSAGGTGHGSTGMRRGNVPPLRHAEFGLEALTRMHQLSSLLGEERENVLLLCMYCQFLISELMMNVGWLFVWQVTRTCN